LAASDDADLFGVELWDGLRTSSLFVMMERSRYWTWSYRELAAGVWQPVEEAIFDEVAQSAWEG